MKTRLACVITALLISRRRGISTALSMYLALMLCYGLAVSFNDGWNEQVVKRGWTTHNPPSERTGPEHAMAYGKDGSETIAPTMRVMPRHVPEAINSELWGGTG